MKAYEPGQSNIDGGGFDIVSFDPKAGYMYVQFESLKNGFIDDLELALVGDDIDKNAVQVRSSSRLGYVSPFFVETLSSPLVRKIHSSFHFFLLSLSWTSESMRKELIIWPRICGQRGGMRQG